VSCYWDNSALINALLSPAVMVRLKKEGGVSRSHTLAEFFGTMTGRGIETAPGQRLKLDPSAAAQWLNRIAKFLTWHDLSAAEVLSELQQTRARNVMGARVHDYLHAAAAVAAHADKILTRDQDFANLGFNIKAEKP